MNNRYRFDRALKNEDGILVYRAIDTRTNQPVLVKNISRTASPVLIRQFRMESQVLSSISHPNIPRLLDVEEQEDAFVLYEEWIEGVSLEKWLAACPDGAARKRVFVQIVRLIDLVHKNGFLYLDLKPEHIILRQECACLVDFNACVPIGTILIHMASTSSIPPEANSGIPLNEKADQYGLGKLSSLILKSNRIAKKACQQDPGLRYESLSEMAACFQNRKRKTLGALGCSLGIMLTLSSMLLQSSEPPAALPAAGREQILAAVKSAEPEADDHLFDMIEQGSLPEHLLSDQEVMGALGNLCLDQNQSLQAQMLLQEVDELIWKEQPLLCLRLKLLCDQIPDLDEIDAALAPLSKSGGAGSIFQSLCESLLLNEIPLSKDLFLQFNELCTQISLDSKQACSVMQLFLYQASILNCKPALNKQLIEQLETSEQGNSLLTLYRKIKI